MNDITTKNDIERLVRAFYARATADELLAPHFAGIDFEHHFPRMIDFWAFLLLDEFGFQGNVFDAHRHLRIDETHFTRWLLHFHTTIDELFTGEKAELAKQRADSIGAIFQTKLKYLS